MAEYMGVFQGGADGWRLLVDGGVRLWCRHGGWLCAVWRWSSLGGRFAATGGSQRCGVEEGSARRPRRAQDGVVGSDGAQNGLRQGGGPVRPCDARRVQAGAEAVARRCEELEPNGTGQDCPQVPYARRDARAGGAGRKGGSGDLHGG